MTLLDTMRLPKVELHLHLDCSVTYNVAQHFLPGITRDEFHREFIAPTKCRDLTHYLSCVGRSVDLMQTREGLRRVTEDLVKLLTRDEVIYAEIRFAPLLHLNQGLTPEEVIEETNAAVDRAVQGTTSDVRLILCTLRHYTAEQSMQTVKLLERFRGTRVVALDIAGDEAHFPLTNHVAAFDYAHEHGLACTAHAGEASGPESVWETLKLLKPSRIGHGVRSLEDEKLLDYLVANHIHLEVCPTSNVQTNVVDTYRDHQIDKLYRRGVSIGINTDSRTINNVSPTEEYASLQRFFGWNSKQFLDCNLNAVDAAFVDEQTKAQLKKRLLKVYEPEIRRQQMDAGRSAGATAD